MSAFSEIWVGTLAFWPSTPSGYLFVASMVVMIIMKYTLESVLPTMGLPATSYKNGELDPNLCWFSVHAMANAFVCAYAFNDTVHVMANPLDSFAPSEALAHAIVMAVHIFHCKSYAASRSMPVVS